MIRSVQYKAILDANVIYQVVTRDILLWFAHHRLYTPKWSASIIEEVRKTMLRTGTPPVFEVDRNIESMVGAFPDAMIENYESLISVIQCPDENDKHIIAAALKGEAHIIVTNNLKHFPEELLQNQYSLDVKTPDEFLADIIDLDAKTAKKAFYDLVTHKVKPPMNYLEVLESFRKAGLAQTANILHPLV